MSVYVILAAGGSGSRMGLGVNKVLLPLCGASVLCRSLRLFEGLIDGLVLVSRPEDLPAMKAEAALSGVSYPVSLVPGGDTRQASVWNGLKSLSAAPEDLVLVHDAARCLTPVSVIREVIASCRAYRSGIPGVPAVNTIKVCDPAGFVSDTPDRSALFEIQTPQGFLFGDLFSSYQKAEAESFAATDDASVMEYAGFPVRVVPGSRENIKLTGKEDLLIAKAMLSQNTVPFRSGLGYDVHRLVENRKLILCGVEIPHTLGLLGHSDADVALHALMDAMLGAAALGDIGQHFPDTDPAFEGVSSLFLLEKVNDLIHAAGFSLVNTDITIAAQRPKLAPHIPLMREKIASALSCDISQISVKATTTEKLGFEGRQEGISAQAVCLLTPHQ